MAIQRILGFHMEFNYLFDRSKEVVMVTQTSDKHQH